MSDNKLKRFIGSCIVIFAALGIDSLLFNRSERFILSIDNIFFTLTFLAGFEIVFARNKRNIFVFLTMYLMILWGIKKTLELVGISYFTFNILSFIFTLLLFTILYLFLKKYHT